MLKFLRCTAASVAILAGSFFLACQPSFAASPSSAAPHADWCKRLSPRLPGISTATCQQSGLQPTGAVSRRGFPILMRSVSPAKPGKETVRVLLLGGIHGDELTAAAIVFEWMQWMQTGTAQQFHWNVVPVMNPDGLLAARPQRVNANGVDLNRNFPTPDWEKDAAKYWVRVTGKDPRRFPGKAPLSEPETRWLDEEIARFHPHVVVSVHAPFGVLDFDGPAPAPQRFGRLYFNRVGVYPGSLGNYGGLHKNVPVITIELPHSLKMPPRDEVRRIWLDMVSWIDRNVPNKQQQAEATTKKTSLKR